MSTAPHNSAIDSGAVSLPQAPTRKRWTREEYYRLGDEGWFQDQRVELIDGEIIVLTPQSSQHAFVIGQLTSFLSQIFDEGFWIRSQLPLYGGEHAEPEPDVCVVLGQPSDYLEEHPKSALLIVEVSFSSLDYDEKVKSHLYASMNVPDYWVVDLENRQLLVHRQPIADEQAPFGHRYEQVETISAEGHVSPLERAEAQVAVAELLPPVAR